MLTNFEDDCPEDGFEHSFDQTYSFDENYSELLTSRRLDSDTSFDRETSFDSGYSSPVDFNQSITSSSDPLLSAHITDLDNQNTDTGIKMEKCENVSEPVTEPDDSTQVDLSFDEWDKNFIASFEENVFNLIDDEGKNLGFILSPDGKGSTLFLSPEGKKLSPDSLRKKFATPSPLNKYMSILGNKRDMMGNLPSSKLATMTPSMCDGEITSTLPQPKKQLFPLEGQSPWKSPRSLMAETMVSGGTSASQDLMTLPWPSEGKLQAARSRFSQALEIAVQRTAQQVEEHKLKFGPVNEEAGIKYPELRHALVTKNSEKVEPHINKMDSGVKLKVASVKTEKKVKPSTAAPPPLRKPYSKENRQITTYSRIQPKQKTIQRIAFARFH